MPYPYKHNFKCKFNHTAKCAIITFLYKRPKKAHNICCVLFGLLQKHHLIVSEFSAKNYCCKSFSTGRSFLYFSKNSVKVVQLATMSAIGSAT